MRWKLSSLENSPMISLSYEINKLKEGKIINKKQWSHDINVIDSNYKMESRDLKLWG